MRLEKVLDDVSLLSASTETLRDSASPLSGRWFTNPVTKSEFIEYVAKRVYTRDQPLGLRYFDFAIAAESDPSRKRSLRRQLVMTHRKLAREAETTGKL